MIVGQVWDICLILQVIEELLIWVLEGMIPLQMSVTREEEGNTDKTSWTPWKWICNSFYKQRTTSDDHVLWRRKHDHSNRIFSTKDIWHNIRSPLDKAAWHNSVWFSHETPEQLFCTWLAMKNRLTTGDQTMNWNVGVIGKCVFCDHLKQGLGSKLRVAIRSEEMGA